MFAKYVCKVILVLSLFLGFAPSFSLKANPMGSNVYDVNGDGLAELIMFNNGTWTYLHSPFYMITSQRSLGQAGDIPVQEFYFGFNSGYTVWRPSNGTWYFHTNPSQQFGLNTDKPRPWDYDGDGYTDLVVFRDGTWLVLRSSDQTILTQSWGLAGDIPIAGYFFSGDINGDFAIFRPATSTWWALDSRSGSVKIRQFGATGDKVVPADYDGDSLTDFAIFRPTLIDGTNYGVWWILKSSTDAAIAFQWGLGNDLTVQADYDGDLKADAATYRVSNGVWYIRESFDGDEREIGFGAAGDVPVQNILYR